MHSRFITKRRILLGAVFFAVVAIVACGGGDEPAPIPVGTVVPIGPQTEDEAIRSVRDWLADTNFEGGFNCLETLEAGESRWSATRPDETQWAVTLRADPPAMLFNVHTWGIFVLDGQIESNRFPC